MCPGISEMGGKNEWWKSMKCVKNENWWWRIEHRLARKKGLDRNRRMRWFVHI
jgi:hypothetical protein